MALEDIRDKIIEDANKLRNDLIKKAEEKRESVIREFREKSEAYQEESLSLAQEEADNHKKGIITDARLKYRNDILRKKREIMEELISEAVKAFTASPEYPSLMTASIKKYQETGQEEIIVSASEKKLDNDWLKKTNQQCASRFTFAEEKGEFSGGLILKNGEVYKNLTTDTLIDQARVLLEKELSRILF